MEVQKNLSCKIDEVSSKLNENEQKNSEVHEHLNISVQGIEEKLIKKIDDKIDQLIERQDKLFKSMEESRQEQNQTVDYFKDDARDLIEKVNEVSEKIMDFEKNKRTRSMCE